jgi:hypothetical protein
VLSDIAVWIYQGITKVMEEEVQPFLVVALLEHEGIGGLSGQFSPVLRIRDPVPFLTLGSGIRNRFSMDPRFQTYI